MGKSSHNLEFTWYHRKTAAYMQFSSHVSQTVQLQTEQANKQRRAGDALYIIGAPIRN